MPRGFLWFAGLVVVLSGVIAILRPDVNVTPFLLVLVPPVAATAAAVLNGGRPAVRLLFKRITRWQAPGQMYAVAIGVPLLLTLGIDVAGLLSGQTSAGHLVASLRLTVLIVPLVVLLPAFFEEYGWRGYGIPVLVHAGRSPLVAALAVFVIFVIPHLVLHLPGQEYAGLPAWPTPLTLFGYSMFLAWLFLRTGGSSFLCAIAHASLNGLVPLTRGLDSVWVWQARGLLSIVLGLVFVVLLSRAGRSDHAVAALPTSAKYASTSGE